MCSEETCRQQRKLVRTYLETRKQRSEEDNKLGVEELTVKILRIWIKRCCLEPNRGQRRGTATANMKCLKIFLLLYHVKNKIIKKEKLYIFIIHLWCIYTPHTHTYVAICGMSYRNNEFGHTHILTLSINFFSSK